MRGELRLVIDRLALEVWLPIIESHDQRDEIAGAVFGAVVPHMHDRYTPDPHDGAPEKPLALRAAEAAEDYNFACSELESLRSVDFISEVAAVRTVSAVRDLLDEYDDTNISTYRARLSTFVERYSLRYYVTSTTDLRVTLPGLSTSCFYEFRKICSSSNVLRAHLDSLEHALADSVENPIPMRIENTLNKLFILMEAVASNHPDAQGVTERTFGKLCQGIKSWPHASVREAAENFYKFACDYPGIRHAGTPGSAKRPLEAKDLVAMCTAMLGLLAYLHKEIPDAAGLRIERVVRATAEPLVGAARSW